MQLQLPSLSSFPATRKEIFFYSPSIDIPLNLFDIMLQRAFYDPRMFQLQVMFSLKWLVVEISWIFFWAVSVATSSGIIYAALGFHGCLLRWIMQVHHSRMTGLIYSNGPDCKLKSWKRIGELYQIDCGFEACWFNITSFFLVSGHYGAWIAVWWC